MATIRDVAKLAGVSISTISRYLNKSGYVSSETEQNIKAAIDKLKYEPSAVARGLTGKKINTIALILPDISNLFFSVLARAVEDVASMYGYTVIFCNTDDQGGKERNYIEVLKKKYIDGIATIYLADGDNSIVVVPGANCEVRPSDIDLRRPNKAS